MFIAWPLESMGVRWAFDAAYAPDMGSSVASLVCWGIFLARANGRWRHILMLATFCALGLAGWIGPLAAQVDHILAFPLGLLIGAWTRAKETPRSASE